ncbi:hypothetical protein [Bradyrhizobium sp. CB2312]|uniref:hypothetical protein n=1 Tax=Bradyrhizobium sp. CB2312 TaxID=3039155 RepID=UPI0024B10B83|nr:hypothetical protein [Bradyrhizobium sp. CB2312]WFU75227.1 hypothetical protein QA642_14980 [Bradyrhizobium sp. CB2312]
MTRDAIEAELLEIELILSDDQLRDEDRAALFGAQQALLNVLDPETWRSGSQTFYRVGARPMEAASRLRH